MGKETEGKTANPVHSQWLLEAVRKIRQQKQRPNVDRILHAMKSCHKISDDVVQEQLDLAVKAGSIIRVFNKGDCSYRDPKWVLALSNRQQEISEETDLTRFVVKSLREIGDAGGSPVPVLEKYIRTSYHLKYDNDSDFTIALKGTLKRCLNSGRLIKEGRNYRTPPTAKEEAVAAIETFNQTLAAHVKNIEKNKVRTD